MPGTAIRNRTTVGPLTVLQRVSIASNVSLGSHCRIEDAVIDNGAQIGSFVHVEASTGAIIGADAQIGDRCTLDAEAVIGRGAKVSAGRRVGKVPDGGIAV